MAIDIKQAVREGLAEQMLCPRCGYPGKDPRAVRAGKAGTKGKGAAAWSKRRRVAFARSGAAAQKAARLAARLAAAEGVAEAAER